MNSELLGIIQDFVPVCVEKFASNFYIHQSMILFHVYGEIFNFS